jgi:hypothetical protein
VRSWSFSNRRAGPLAAGLISLVFLVTGVSANPGCFDRTVRPHTSVVDTHLHFRPFGGPPIPFTEIIGYLNKTGVRFVNAYGIGQTLPANSSCEYYLDCKETPVVPTIKNDFVNAANYLDHKPQGVHVTLSMTFPDLASPDSIVDQIHLLDREFPGLFKWMGEVNLVKEALFDNGHRPTPQEAIQRWAPFMSVLRDRGIPITIHSDIGINPEPTKYLHLMEQVLDLYPENKIVWAHMGLSKELTTMDPELHTKLLSRFLDTYDNLMLDISWDVVYKHYFSDEKIRERYVALFNEYPTRILPGSDFVASRYTSSSSGSPRRLKGFDDYRKDLETTSFINEHLSNEAFRNIALGQNYFRLLGLNEQAPQVCGTLPDTD